MLNTAYHYIYSPVNKSNHVILISLYPPYYLVPLSAVSFNISTAFFIMEGIGTPISPAFSTIESTSFAINPMHTAFLMYSTPRTISRRAAIRTYSKVIPFLQSPFHPALLSNAPLGDFGLLRNTAGSMIPPVSQSKTIKINNVFNAVSQPPNSSATVLPKRAITVKILYFMLAFLHFS